MNPAHGSVIHPAAVIVDALYVGTQPGSHPQHPGQHVMCWVLRTSPRSAAYAMVVNAVTINFKAGTTEQEARKQARSYVAKNVARFISNS